MSCDEPFSITPHPPWDQRKKTDRKYHKVKSETWIKENFKPVASSATIIEASDRSGGDFENPSHLQVKIMATVAWFSQSLGQSQKASTFSQHKKSKLNCSVLARGISHSHFLLALKKAKINISLAKMPSYSLFYGTFETFLCNVKIKYDKNPYL